MKSTSTLALVLLGLALPGTPVWSEPPLALLKEESVRLQYTSTAREAVLVFSAESESALEKLEVRDPLGATVLKLAGSPADALSISGFRIETREMPLEELLATYGEGEYRLAARTEDGRPAFGRAQLSLALPRPARILYPAEGEADVPVELLVSWAPDPTASGYTIEFEQNENDGLTASLPAGSSSFRVPAGVLRPGTPSHLEIGTVNEHGNTTLVERAFTTR